MAEAVEEALAEGRHLLVEAGTGVGKSFAYLVPILLHLAAGGGPAVVATRTIALQEQLTNRDIPLLKRALGLEEIQVALAKGRGNYICRRRLEMARKEGRGLFERPAQLEQLERIHAWAGESRDGSRAELPFRPQADLWDAIRAESGNCLQQRCRFFGTCAYQRSRRSMRSAQLLIANHSLVFSDLALREAGATFLPDYDCLILDEAHEVEDGACENFGVRLSSVGIARQLGRFMGTRRGAGLFGRIEVGKELYEEVERTRAALKSLFEGVDRLRGKAGEVRIRQPRGFEDPLSLPLTQLLAALRARHGSIEDPEVALEWKSRTDRLEETLHAVRLVHGTLDSDLVYWAEGSGGNRRSVLRAAPIEVAPILRRTLFSKVRCVVLTSATLRVGDSFEHLQRRLGLEEPEAKGLGSPFDFARQCRLLLFGSLPDPRNPAYDEAVVKKISELVHASSGGAFVLFTSYRALLKAHDALAPALEDAGLLVLRQGSDLRTQDIMRAFRERQDCVLFATNTFWQGIDVPGRNLRLVIITRLPFAVPDHPLQQARMERIQESGGDPFRQLSLPQAVLKLRQGFGRLIRSHGDSGAVAILDPRILTKGYGRTFLASLPDGLRWQVDTEASD